MNFTLALAQIDPVLGNIEENIEKHVATADRALRAGAHLVAFPELSLTGYSVKDMHWELAVNVEKDPSRFRRLIDKSKEIAIIAGGVEEGSGFGIYNSAFLFDGGRVSTVHRKTYPPTYGMFEEMRYFSSGTSVRAFDTALGRMGVLICEDLWHLSLPYILACDGAQVIIALVASPTRMSGPDATLQAAVVNTENHKAYARLLSAYIVFCNRVGYEDGVNFWGGSQVVAPGGDVVGVGKVFDEDLVVVEIDEDAVRRARRFSRHFLDEDPTLVWRELSRITGKIK
jgi:predicted amidohydrolase